jgi:hypothetical protein
MINATLNSTTIYNLSHTMDCGTLTISLIDKVSTTFKIIVFVILGLVLFEGWAISRISKSGESHDRKKELIDITLTFIQPIIVVLIFYMIYWIFLSGIDF